MGLSSVTLVGAVSREVKSFGKGCSFSVEWEESWGDKSSKRFMGVKCFGRSAESAEKLKVGDFVAVTGSIGTESWDDKKTGEKKYATVVVANTVSKLGGGSSQPDDPRDWRG